MQIPGIVPLDAIDSTNTSRDGNGDFPVRYVTVEFWEAS